MLLMISLMHLVGLLCAGALLIPALRGPDAPDSGSDGRGGGGPGNRRPNPAGRAARRPPAA